MLLFQNREILLQGFGINVRLVFFAVVVLFLSPLEATAQTPQLLLAERYAQGIDVSQYLVSEKLDGVRAYWDGEKLLTRNGNVIQAPTWFVRDFPRTKLDGELWIGHKRFDELSAIIRKTSADDAEWLKIKYMLFELPDESTQNFNFAQRVEQLNHIALSANIPWLQVIPQTTILNHQELQKLFQSTIKAEGEGLMLHRKSATYKTGRSNDLLKLTPYLDAEAKVIQTIEGRGKYQGMMGALIVQMNDGKTFKIGSGFTDPQRKTPPALGAMITYSYRELTPKGIPRFPVFVRVRD